MCVFVHGFGGGVDDGENKSGVKLKMNCLSRRNVLQRGAGSDDLILLGL